MGSNISDMERPRKVLETRNESETSHRVLAFHSKDQWKSHFEASKQTDKLVTLHTIVICTCVLTASLFILTGLMLFSGAEVGD
jgi:hypothetical protein